ncbi:MAG: hypothetical protein IKF53_05845 [Clostridia bacterium]|nr:hypothetical protein [Clostridia bacterium]
MRIKNGAKKMLSLCLALAMTISVFTCCYGLSIIAAANDEFDINLTPANEQIASGGQTTLKIDIANVPANLSSVALEVTLPSGLECTKSKWGEVTENDPLTKSFSRTTMAGVLAADTSEGDTIIDGTLITLTLNAKAEAQGNQTVSVSVKFMKAGYDKDDPDAFITNTAECSIRVLCATHTLVNTASAEYLKTAADCTNAAVYYKHCSVCGLLSDETFTSGTALGHTPGAIVKENEVSASCVEDGGYDNVVYCTVCNAEISREHITIKANGHTPGTAVKENEVAASCTVDGGYNNVVYCTVCGAEISRDHITVDKIPHNYIATVTPNTCTEGGYTTYTCSVCGYSYITDEVPASGHNWDNGVVTKAATCTESGIITYTCQNDPTHTKEEVIYPTSHTLKTRCENKIAPTCTANGSVVKVTYCTVCNTEISRTTEVLTALGHSLSDTISIYNKGHGYRCTRCGEIELTNHTYGEGTCVREATYALKGKYESVCTVCGYKGYYETNALEIEGEIVDGVYYENGVPTHKGLILMEDGYYYYIDANGNLVKDATRFVGNKWANAGVKAGEYTFDENGKMVVNTTVEPTDREGIVDGIYYEFNEPVHKGVIKVDEDYYYVKSLGIVVKNTTKYINKQYSNGIIEPGTYEIDENGKIINPKVVGEKPQIDTSLNGIVGDYYYVNGIPTHVGFIKIGDYYYYIESGGKVVKNKTRFVYNNMTNGLLPQGFYSFDAEGHANVK